jgi:N-acetylmuramoyl-L-alanine amidase
MKSTLNRSFLIQLVSSSLIVALIAFSAGWLSVSPRASAQDVGGFSADQAVVVATDALNLRDDASSSAGVVAILPVGTFGVVLDGPITADDYDWYLIEVDGTSGYVAGTYLADAATDGSFAIGDTVAVNTDALALRDSATLSGAMVSILSTGMTGTVLDGPVEADGYAWYQLDIDGTTGWAVRDFLAYGVASTDPAAAEVAVGGAGMMVNTDALNVRDTAGIDGTVLETLALGDTVSVTGSLDTADGYDWTQIETATGTTGWVVSNYLTADSTDLELAIGTVAFVNTDALTLRDTPALAGAALATLFTGEEVTILSASEAADGYLWYQVETASGTGWVAGDFLGV